MPPPQGSARGDRLAWFRGGQPLRSLPTGEGAPDRLLISALGSALWYRGDQRWRRQAELIRAAEGFWTLSPSRPGGG